MPVPTFTQLEELSQEDESSTSAVNSTREHGDSDFKGTSSVVEVFSQPELNDLIRDLKLSKKSAELLVSRLAESNLLQPGTKIMCTIGIEKWICCHSSRGKIYRFLQRCSRLADENWYIKI